MQRRAGLLVYHNSLLANDQEKVDQFGGYASYSITRALLRLEWTIIRCVTRGREGGKGGKGRGGEGRGRGGEGREGGRGRGRGGREGREGGMTVIHIILMAPQ